MEKGFECHCGIRARAFGEVFKAQKPPNKEYFAIKKLGAGLGGEYTENEINLLKKCTSKFIVKLLDVVQQDDVTWVTDGIITSGADCNGVLLPWLVVFLCLRRYETG